jgi:hypothetical protein
MTPEKPRMTRFSALGRLMAKARKHQPDFLFFTGQD